MVALTKIGFVVRGKRRMSYEDLKAGGYYGYGYEGAIEEVKDILKKQPFMTFNFLEQYSVRPMITQKEINNFLKELLNWVFQSSGETTKKEVNV